MREIDVKDLRYQVKIRFAAKPEGHVFTVHRLGGGADLRTSQLMREAGRLADRLNKAGPDEDLTDLYKAIDDLHEEQFKIKASVFDDGTADQKLSIALAKELTEAEVQKIVEAVESNTSIVASEDAQSGEANEA